MFLVNKNVQTKIKNEKQIIHVAVNSVDVGSRLFTTKVG